MSLPFSGIVAAGLSMLFFCLTTTAIWLWPFWNSFSISYNGIVSGTLQVWRLRCSEHLQICDLLIIFTRLVKVNYLGILRMATLLTGTSLSGWTVSKFFTCNKTMPWNHVFNNWPDIIWHPVSLFKLFFLFFYFYSILCCKNLNLQFELWVWT